MRSRTRTEAGGAAASTAVTRTVRFTVLGQPVAKPRMTRRDIWRRRPCVVSYRAWCDLLRRHLAILPVQRVWRGYAVRLDFYLRAPARVQDLTRPHDVKPDLDNLVKGVLDALFGQDQVVVDLSARKQWADARGPRVEITIT